MVAPASSVPVIVNVTPLSSPALLIVTAEFTTVEEIPAKSPAAFNLAAPLTTASSSAAVVEPESVVRIQTPFESIIPLQIINPF